MSQKRREEKEVKERRRREGERENGLEKCYNVCIAQNNLQSQCRLHNDIPLHRWGKKHA